jgi:acyl-CoA dehydrogenase
LLQIPAVLELMRGWVPLEFGGGWRAMTDKSEHYDLAGSVLLRTVISEEAAAAAPGLYLALPGPSLTEPIVTGYGTAAQKAIFFSSFTGQAPCWGAFAMSEPGAGSDVAAIRTSARFEDGVFKLNGCKWFIGNAARAEWFVVFATSNSKAGMFALRAFLIRRGTPGLVVDKLLPTMGLRALQVAQISLKDCCVPPECELRLQNGQSDKAGIFRGGMRTFQAFRPLVAALAIGTARAAVDYTREFVQQDGASHAGARSWERNRVVLQDLSSRIRAGRLLYRHAAELYDGKVDNTKEAALAKAFAARLAVDAVSECMRITGPTALIAGSPLGMFFRDAVAFDILEGTGDMMRLAVARGALAARSAIVPDTAAAATQATPGQSPHLLNSSDIWRKYGIHNEQPNNAV